MTWYAKPGAVWAKPLAGGQKSICIAVATWLIVASPVLAANNSDASTNSLNQINVPGVLFEVIEQALAGSKQQAAALDYQLAASNARASLGDLKPKIALGVQAKADAPYTDTQERGFMAGPSLSLTLPMGQGQTDLTLGAVSRSGYAQPVGAQASLTTRLPLFAGPDTREANAEQSLLVAKATYQAKQQQVVLDAVNAYYNVMYAEEGLILAKQLRQLAELDYTLGQEQFQRGALASAELYRLRAAQNNAFDAVMSAKFQLEESQASLLTIMRTVPPELATIFSNMVSTAGSNPATNTYNIDNTATTATPTGALSAAQTGVKLMHVNTPVEPANAAAWVSIALQKRSDMQVAQQAVELANLALRKAKALVGKDVALVAGATWPNSVSETKVDLRTDVQAGFQATFHLYDSRRHESVVSAENALAKAKLQLTELEQAITRAISASLHRMEEADQALAQARAQLAQDEMALTVVRERLSQGLAVSREVAAQELTVAQQASRVRKLEGQQVAARLTLWNTAGLDIVELHYPLP